MTCHAARGVERLELACFRGVEVDCRVIFRCNARLGEPHERQHSAHKQCEAIHARQAFRDGALVRIVEFDIRSHR